MESPKIEIEMETKDPKDYSIESIHASLKDAEAKLESGDVDGAKAGLKEVIQKCEESIGTPKEDEVDSPDMKMEKSIDSVMEKIKK